MLLGIQILIAGALWLIQQQSPGFVLRVNSHLVIVDAVVTDSSGTPVRDLTKDDFRLFENGKAQDVQVFSFQDSIADARTAARETIPRESTREENAYTNIPKSNGDSAPMTVLLIDGVNTPTANRPFLYKQLMKYVDRQVHSGRVAVYLLGNRLRLLQDFTADPAQLRASLKKFVYETSIVTNEHPTDSVNDQLVRDIGNMTLKLLDAAMLRALQQFEDDRVVAQTDARVAMTLNALRHIGRYVAGYPGRKNLIWVSEGFPLVSISEVSGTVRNNYTADMRRTTSALTDAQVAIYPVDARGLVDTNADITLESYSTSPAIYLDDMRRRNAVLDNAHESMNVIAEQTGGRAFYNRNDIDGAIAQGVMDGAAYYTLGYYPTDKNWDGSFRRIEVKLQRSGLQVRSRRGYFAIDQQSSAGRSENAGRTEFLESLVPGNPSVTALPFTVNVRPPAEKNDAVELEFRIDPHFIVFTKQNNDSQHSELNFVVRAFNSESKLVAADSRNVQMDLKPATFAEAMRSSGVSFHQSIRLQRGDYVLEIGVRDTRSNLTGSLSAHVAVP